VVAAAGNSGNDDRHSIPPANSPSVITVGGYNDNNQLDRGERDLYHSNFGATADGSIKPEIIAPAMWVPAPILPGTVSYRKAEVLSRLASAPDYQLSSLMRECGHQLELPPPFAGAKAEEIRQFIELLLNQNKIVANHYQHVDGTSFAAPIVSSIVAQMIQANPRLTPRAVKNILVSTAYRIANAPAIRQGYGVVNASRAVALARTEQHALKTVGCGPPRIANGRLRFVFHDDEAKSVSLAGDFNHWDTTNAPLVRDSDGLWQTELNVPPSGVYQYKFLIDGERWLEDPSNGMKVPDNFGGLNSELMIE
jgi:serine protease AprX